MRRFTDSPFEALMQEPPKTEAPAAPLLPPEHPCYGCGNYSSTPCVGLCTRELLKHLNEKEANHETGHR